jgi:hypothetical protein
MQITQPMNFQKVLKQLKGKEYLKQIPTLMRLTVLLFEKSQSIKYWFV